VGAYLRRFEITALRPTSRTNPALISIPQAQVDFSLQGATVNGSPVSISTASSGTVTVVGIGSFTAGDNVRVGISGVILSVASVPSSTQLTLSNSTGLTVVVESGTRLINLSRRPTVFQDQLGTLSMTPPVLADSGGRATVYLPAGSYDYVTAGLAAFDALLRHRFQRQPRR
jgi:hypothetical protein